MDVKIVTFPETKVAAIDHFGPPDAEYETVRKLVAWKLQHRLTDPARNRQYGLHYTYPGATAPQDHHVEFCLSVDGDVASNAFGIVAKIIPAQRCALARDIGSRSDNNASAFLWLEWLPASGETPSGAPAIFHYVNVGPNVRPEDMITDVYLPLR